MQARGLKPFSIYQGGLDASWEVDLWGRVRRSVESSNASVVAAEDVQRGVLLSTLAEVARDYIQLRGTQAQLQIARDNVKIAEQSLRLTRQRAEGGVTTDLDVAQASAQLKATLADIPPFEQQEAELINALSFLVGQPPNALRAELEVSNPVPPVPPRVPAGVPSELAQRRPDIRQAEAQLHATTADIGVAQANFYPSAEPDRLCRLAVAAVESRVRPELKAVCAWPGPDHSAVRRRPPARHAAAARGPAAGGRAELSADRVAGLARSG